MNNPRIIDSKHIIHATVLCLMAAFCYSAMLFLVKLVAKNTTESMTVFIRFSVSLFWILLIISYKKLQGKNFPLKTKHFGIHLLRATCSFIAMLSLYYALKRVSLVDATSLAMTYALFIPILSFIFFSTRTNTKNWLALIAGFIGVIFILKPYSNDFNPAVLMALVSGLATAGSLVGVYELAKDEKPHTIMLYYFPMTFIFSGIFTIFNWKTPSLNTLMVLLVSGIAGTAYQELVTRSMTYAPPKIVAPLLYFSIIFSGLFDWAFWHHIPDLYFWIGTLLVALGCIYSVKYTQT